MPLYKRKLTTLKGQSKPQKDSVKLKENVAPTWGLTKENMKVMCLTNEKLIENKFKFNDSAALKREFGNFVKSNKNYETTKEDLKVKKRRKSYKKIIGSNKACDDISSLSQVVESSQKDSPKNSKSKQNNNVSHNSTILPDATQKRNNSKTLRPKENSQNNENHSVINVLQSVEKHPKSNTLHNAIKHNMANSPSHLNCGNHSQSSQPLSDKAKHLYEYLSQQKSVELEPPMGLTQRERLEWLQTQRDVGVYVHCDKCDKLRYLEHVKDPLELPNKWFCSMNPDKTYNNCSIPEATLSPYDEVLLIQNAYNAGSVVWAKMDGYPWWPGLVDDCPDTEQFYWVELYSDIPTYYNVTFFDKAGVTRAWIKTSHVQKFLGNQPNSNSRLFRRYESRIRFAINQANDALNLSLRERLGKYSFLARWNKPINPPKIGHKNDIEASDLSEIIDGHSKKKRKRFTSKKLDGLLLKNTVNHIVESDKSLLLPFTKTDNKKLKHSVANEKNNSRSKTSKDEKHLKQPNSELRDFPLVNLNHSAKKIRPENFKARKEHVDHFHMSTSDTDMFSNSSESNQTKQEWSLQNAKKAKWEKNNYLQCGKNDAPIKTPVLKSRKMTKQKYKRTSPPSSSPSDSDSLISCHYIQKRRHSMRIFSQKSQSSSVIISSQREHAALLENSKKLRSHTSISANVNKNNIETDSVLSSDIFEGNMKYVNDILSEPVETVPAFDFDI